MAHVLYLKRLFAKSTVAGFIAALVFGCLVAQPAVAASGGGDPVAEAPFYLEMRPLSVPIRKKSGSIRYYMFLTVSLEFDENDKKDKGRKVIPRLRDAFLQDLSGRSVMHKNKKKGMDFELIKKRLMKQAAKVLKEDAPIGVNIVRIQKGG